MISGVAMCDEGGTVADSPLGGRGPFRLSVRRLLAIVLTFGCVFEVVAWIWGQVWNAREAARDSQCLNNLKMIGLALLNYHDAVGCFPPAYIADAGGKPMHSWRVLLMPYLESSPLYNQYKFSEPWDGPSNRTLASRMFSLYACPSDPGHLEGGLTSYFVVVGQETCFPSSKSMTIVGSPASPGSLPDMITVVECSDVAVPWMEPRDLDLNRMSFRVNDPARPGISSRHPGGANVVEVCGRVRKLYNATPPAEVRAALTIRGRVIDRPRGTP